MPAVPAPADQGQVPAAAGVPAPDGWVPVVPLPRSAEPLREGEVPPTAGGTGGPDHRGRRRAAQALLTLLSLTGLVVTGLTVTAAASGLQPLVVRSGSMEPAIPTGAVVLVRDVPATALRVGDVAAVRRPDGTLVTHRVVGSRQEGEAAALLLKGDANREPDPDEVLAARAGRVVGTLPLAGLLASELTSARGGFVLGCLMTVVVRSGRRRSGRAP